MTLQELEDRSKEITHMLETANALLEIALINFRQIAAANKINHPVDNIIEMVQRAHQEN